MGEELSAMEGYAMVNEYKLNCLPIKKIIHTRILGFSLSS